MTIPSKSHRPPSCHRHPAEAVTGFCAYCLRERLAGIESSAGHGYTDQEVQLAPELRRTKSFSGSGHAAFATAISEPRRRSCEVRARSTLWDLFNLDNEKKGMNRKFEVELGSLSYEIREEEEQIEDVNGAVRVCGGSFVSAMDEDDEVDEEEETKTMKEFIDLELQVGKNAGRDFRDIAGSFWEAASAFSKKLRKWRRKQKMKKQNVSRHSAGVGLTGLKVEKPRNRTMRETQSEVGEYGLGRRSCDTDPRLSLDAGRMSLDDSRISLDVPRASWDGYLIGKACPRLSPMISVVEDTNVSVNVIENGVSSEEKVNLEGAGESNPGGSAQTKDYYSDSLSWQQRRRSFDRSNSHRKSAIPEVDELKLISNAKVSPATTELFYGAKLLITEKELMDRGLKSPKNVQTDSVLGSTSEDASDAATGVNQKGLGKLPNWRKMWNKLGMVQKKKEKKLEEEHGTGDVVNKPITDSWQKLRRAVNGQTSESVSQKLVRSYSVSCRNPCRMSGLVNGLGASENKSNVLNGRQDVMLQRNRSARYSPNNADTGLLRFYLTPLKSYRRGKSVKSSMKDLHPTTRSAL